MRDLADMGTKHLAAARTSELDSLIDKDDEVVGLEVVAKDASKKTTLLTVCEWGYGKRTELSEYRNQNRGGSGIITIKSSDRNGAVVGIRLVTDENDVMIMTEKGMAIRLPASLGTGSAAQPARAD